MWCHCCIAHPRGFAKRNSFAEAFSCFLLFFLFFWHLHCFSAWFESQRITITVPFLMWNNYVRCSHCASTLYVIISTCTRYLKADPESVWGPVSSNQSLYESMRHSFYKDGRFFNIVHHYFNECMNVLNLGNVPLIGCSCVLGIISTMWAIRVRSISLMRRVDDCAK